MVSHFRIRTLVDNTVGARGLIGEHGSSIVLEVGDSSILLDCGSSRVAVFNARRAGVDLSKVKTIVLSHGHYDHTGGLPVVLRRLAGKEVTVYAHPNALEPKYSREQDGRLRSIGMPLSAQKIRDMGARLIVTRDPLELMPGVWTSGEIPRGSGPESVEPRFLARRNGVLEPDHIPDDQFIWAKTPSGLVVICGCCHAGLENSLHHAVRMSGSKRIRLVVGGLHLLKMGQEDLRKVVSGIAEYRPEMLAVGHCTGFEAMVALSNAFPSRVIQNTAGTVIDVGETLVVSK